MSFAYARRIAGYSWPIYAAAFAGIAIGVFVIALPATPSALRWFAVAAVAVSVWLAAASFLAFHWMFDRSELLGGRWLAEPITPAPQRWVQINSGLEETTLPMEKVFPGAEGKLLDIFDATSMTEPAIARARQQRKGLAAVAARSDALPVADGWADLVVVMLAAHEIRDAAARERFFVELVRIVLPAGRVVLVEHLRDAAAALAFGPGMFHFLPRREWLRLGQSTGLELKAERSITPFVRVFFYESLRR